MQPNNTPEYQPTLASPVPLSTEQHQVQKLSKLLLRLSASSLVVPAILLIGYLPMISDAGGWTLAALLGFAMVAILSYLLYFAPIALITALVARGLRRYKKSSYVAFIVLATIGLTLFLVPFSVSLFNGSWFSQLGSMSMPMGGIAELIRNIFLTLYFYALMALLLYGYIVLLRRRVRQLFFPDAAMRPTNNG